MAVEISAQMVKELRDRTGAGFKECKDALVDAGGDMEQAIRLLQERGIAKAAKKAGRVAKDGLIHAYIHGGGRIGVLVEVNCETDFVARTDEFQELVHNIALQIAATNPQYIRPEDVPAEVVEEQKEIFRKQVEGKPPHVVEKIVEGKLKKYFEEVCLLEQPYIRDPEIKVGDLITQAIARIGENIVVRRFCRYELGEA